MLNTFTDSVIFGTPYTMPKGRQEQQEEKARFRCQAASASAEASPEDRSACRVGNPTL